MDVKRLLRKRGWTGEETGKALILFMINDYKQILSGNTNTKPLFPPEKIRTMLHGFRTSQADIEAYNRYINLQNWTKQYQAVANAYFQRFQRFAHEFLRIHNAVEDAEKVNSYIDRLPRIVTQKQYDELKAKRIAEQLDPNGDGTDAVGNNVFSLIIRLIYHYAWELEMKPKAANPLKAIKKLYSKRPVENKAYILGYNKANAKEGCIGPPEGLTKWELIRADAKADANFSEYIPALTGEEIAPEVFIADAEAFKKEFPELVEAAFKVLDAMGYTYEEEGAEKPLSSLPVEEWQTTVITWRELYNANFPGFREAIESDYSVFEGDKRALINGVAVIRPIIGRTCAGIDANGYFIGMEGDDKCASAFALDAYLPDNPESGKNIIHVEKSRAALEKSLRYISGFNAAIDIIAEDIGVPEYTIFKIDGDGICLDYANTINMLFDNLYQHIEETDYRDKERKAAKLQVLREVFRHVKTDELQATAEQKKKAAAMLEGLQAFGDKGYTTPGSDFLSLLTEGGEEEGGGAKE